MAPEGLGSLRAVTAAEKVLRETAKGKVGDDLIAKGIADVQAKLN